MSAHDIVYVRKIDKLWHVWHDSSSKEAPKPTKGYSVFHEKKAALEMAHRLVDEFGFVEYGVFVLNCSNKHCRICSLVQAGIRPFCPEHNRDKDGKMKCNSCGRETANKKYPKSGITICDTCKEVTKMDMIEEYILGIDFGGCTEHERTLIAGNLRTFYAYLSDKESKYQWKCDWGEACLKPQDESFPVRLAINHCESKLTIKAAIEISQELTMAVALWNKVTTDSQRGKDEQ